MFERIFNLLKEKGITQTVLAEKIGVRQATISDWKRKKTTPSADTIGLIAEFLGVSTDYLITGKEYAPSPSQTVNQGIFGDSNHDNTVTITGNSTIEMSQFESNQKDAFGEIEREILSICGKLDIKRKNALLTKAYELLEG